MFNIHYLEILMLPEMTYINVSFVAAEVSTRATGRMGSAMGWELRVAEGGFLVFFSLFQNSQVALKFFSLPYIYFKINRWLYRGEWTQGFKGR